MQCVELHAYLEHSCRDAWKTTKRRSSEKHRQNEIFVLFAMCVARSTCMWHLARSVCATMCGWKKKKKNNLLATVCARAREATRWMWFALWAAVNMHRVPAHRGGNTSEKHRGGIWGRRSGTAANINKTSAVCICSDACVPMCVCEWMSTTLRTSFAKPVYLLLLELPVDGVFFFALISLGFFFFCWFLLQYFGCAVRIFCLSVAFSKCH